MLLRQGKNVVGREKTFIYFRNKIFPRFHRLQHV